MIRRALLLVLLLALAAAAPAQEPYEGVTLISPINSTEAHLIELDGTVIETWHGGASPASIAYLLDDGSILRPCADPAGHSGGGGSGGRIQRIDADDVVVWDYYFSSSEHQQHHDIQPMPNGNVLLLAWEFKTRQEAIDAGRQSISSEMWPTLIVEVEPVGSTGGNVVWEWHLWDHLVQDADPAKPNFGVVADHPELVDINYGNVSGGASPGDWLHANAIDYNEQLDQIVFCSRALNELYVIDHSTTTEEAAGHTGGNSGMGGDILYRWGNPRIYDRGTVGDQYFWVVHGVNWIDPGLPGEGNLLAFNNGDRRSRASDYSTVDEITPPVDEYGNYSIDADAAFGPTSPTWTYGGPGVFYGGPTQCGAYRMPNGNTVVCVSTSGYLFEVTTAGATVWEYDHPSGNIARAERYWDDASGVHNGGAPSARLASGINPFAPSSYLRFMTPSDGRVSIDVFDVAGRLVSRLVDRHYPAGEFCVEWDGRDDGGTTVASGIYFATMRGDGFRASTKLALLR